MEGEKSEPPEDRLRGQALASLKGQNGKSLFQVLGTGVATRRRSGGSVLSSQPPRLTLILAQSQRGLSRLGPGKGAESYEQRRAPQDKPCMRRGPGQAGGTGHDWGKGRSLEP